MSENRTKSNCRCHAIVCARWAGVTKVNVSVIVVTVYTVIPDLDHMAFLSFAVVIIAKMNVADSTVTLFCIK
jgi:hypothetical protein